MTAFLFVTASVAVLARHMPRVAEHRKAPYASRASRSLGAG
jgi:hypothetical protein